MKKLFSKLFITYFFVILGLVVLILVFSFFAIKKSYISTLESDLTKINSALTYKIKDYLREDRIVDLQRFIIKYGKKNNVRITLVDSLGIVLADSEEDPAYMENHGTRIEIMKALKDGIGSTIRHSYTLDKDMLYLAMPVYEQGRLIVVSRVSLFVNNIDNLFTEIRNKILLIAGIIFLFSIFIIYIISKSLTKPIVELTNSVRRIAQGDYGTKVFLKTSNELQILANSFNEMSDELRASFQDVKQKQEEISGIIKSIRDAIVVIDSDDNIIMNNKAFIDYFGITNPVGRFFWEVIPNTKFKHYVNNLRHSSEVRVNEIEVADKYFLVSGSINEINRDVIIVFYNITEYKNLENMKRDFISNVSHELKTPLTAIKGFVETMQENADADSKRYLDIIDRQTRRLINTVQDLLLLSHLESPEAEVDKTPINANDLVDNIFALFAQKAEAKQIELIKDIEQYAIIYADGYMMEQVLINLVENALNHTDSGYVKVSVKNKEQHSIISVEDTGKGIAPEHQQRIFERFYTVEKSRSRSFAGTGLGLSIVKHIVGLHKGDISVQSTPGRGSAFIIHI